MMTGGTIAQAVDDQGRMQISKSLDDLVGAARTPHEIRTHSFSVRTGANLTTATVADVADMVRASLDEADGFVLITGTDSMEELAYLLDLTLGIDKPLVLTGAMKPSDIIGYDGIANLEQALQVAGDPEAHGRGVLIAMNDDVHVARYVRKADSQLIGAFVSHPGPVAQHRRGEIIWYYGNTRNPDLYAAAPLRTMNMAVPILIFGFDLPFWPGLLEGAVGAVIAGMGTASIPERWIDELSPSWTGRIPVVLVSRSMKGTNFDDSYYRGSLEKYESKGFHLSAYRDLNPMQARIKLCLEIATKAQD
jgi:L-asparaginase